MKTPHSPVKVRVVRNKRSGVFRSVVKTITYRIVSAVAVMGLAWAMFGSVQVAGTFAAIDAALATVLYYTHERVWAWVDVKPSHGDESQS